MTVAGPLTCGTAADDATVGSLAWANVTFAQGANNGTYSTVASGAGGINSHYLKFTNFGMSIPAGATITEIQWQYDRKSSGAAVVSTFDFREVKAGVIGGTNYAAGGDNWATSDELFNGFQGLGEGGWTPTNVNDSTTGFCVAAHFNSPGTASLDYGQMTVTYTLSLTGPNIIYSQARSRAANY